VRGDVPLCCNACSHTPPHMLVQAPFCVHPKTGKVCVPIDPAQADSFDPDEVPTVQSLLAQLPADAPKVGSMRWGGGAGARVTVPAQSTSSRYMLVSINLLIACC
jgi:DNA primase catalytic subunit